MEYCCTVLASLLTLLTCLNRIREVSVFESRSGDSINSWNLKIEHALHLLTYSPINHLYNHSKIKVT
jgi:hypothetical protein